MTTLPDGLEKLVNLTVGPYINKLTSVAELEKLTKLNYLGLGNNDLTKPNWKLTNLRLLELGGNALTTVAGLKSSQIWNN